MNRCKNITAGEALEVIRDFLKGQHVKEIAEKRSLQIVNVRKILNGARFRSEFYPDLAAERAKLNPLFFEARGLTTKARILTCPARSRTKQPRLRCSITGRFLSSTAK